MRNSKALRTNDAGYVMRCIYTDCASFQVGKDYITERCAINDFNQGCPDIGGGFALNYQHNHVYGVEGARMLAKFVMIRDNSGRYIKRANYRIGGKCRKHGLINDYRRLRRLARNMLKTEKRGDYSYNVLSDLARNAGK